MRRLTKVAIFEKQTRYLVQVANWLGYVRLVWCPGFSVDVDGGTTPVRARLALNQIEAKIAEIRAQLDEYDLVLAEPVEDSE